MNLISFKDSQEQISKLFRTEPHPLDAIFSPKTIAVIGATEREGSVGRTVLWNLMTHPFGGTVFPVNPQRSSVLGIKAYNSISEVPEAVDLVIIATPAKTVPDVVSQCVDAGVKGAIVLSAGFREIGAIGTDLEQQICAHLKRGQMRMIGPNCLGVMNPHLGLNATFANSIAQPGKVGFISQSGALCSAILDWSLHENVGFSSFISIGSMLDVDWGDLIYYLGDDPHTESIVIYMESIGNARSFLSAAREVALTKPIIVIKAGRTEAAAQAATSHTGAMAGSDEVFNAALRRCGVLRVDRISDLFMMAEILAKQPRPKGSRLSIITNAGGPGVLATDALVTNGGTLAELSPDTIEQLNQHLPEHWSHHNPIDILGDADPDRYAKTLEVAVNDPNSDGLLVILTPQSMSDPTETAQQLQQYARIGKPILASWMGNSEVASGADILNQANIPTFAFPDTAARLFNYMWRYSYNLRGIYETPTLAQAETVDQTAIASLIQSARSAGRTLLTEFESKQILAAYGIPTIETEIAPTVDEAVQLAEKLGYPVVLKLHSETITHKTDVGGVQLNLLNAAAVREAYTAIASTVLERTQDPTAFLGVTVQPMIQREGYELIVGSSLDPQFGAVMLFGSGGQLVEVYQDRAIALPPLNTTLARRMIEQTRIYQALQGVRGRKAIDLAALEQLLVRFSQLVVEQRWIKEIEINPLLASSSTLTALDARIVLHDPNVTESELPSPAVRPYPNQFTWEETLPNQRTVTIRPIRPEDEPSLIQFHKTLSEESVYFRYFHLIGLKQRIAHERLTRLCFIDYDRELALVAEAKYPQTGTSEILAIARLNKLHAINEAEFGLMVSDRHQHQGLGTLLLQCLLKVGQHEGIDRIRAEILCENRAMQQICKKLGFQLRRNSEDGVMQAEISL
ncbi:bifunctional acetate--CoA ligase family protein/GNAT family N-acetyltransferase [Leptolyngbya sp. AN03gr2]|uniref:bifunctional acetate--CoA ligase family protein/GNAT family N-acetyltransferase n=1 Tax=unclassified Leptolyngbya TaxID=2650499 RepID=UPI003D314595